jgi:hypothetical protein
LCAWRTCAKKLATDVQRLDSMGETSCQDILSRLLVDPMLKQDDYIKAKLVETAWKYTQFYGGGGHLMGQIIMWCIANRVRAGWGSWLQMLDGIEQFAAENAVPPLKHPSVWDASFVKMLHVVDGIYDGSMPDAAKGGLYWADLSKIERSWFLEKIVQAKDDDGIPRHHRVVDMNSFSVWR